MDADKCKGKKVLVQGFVVAAAATHTKIFIGVHRRPSASIGGSIAFPQLFQL